MLTNLYYFSLTEDGLHKNLMPSLKKYRPGSPPKYVTEWREFAPLPRKSSRNAPANDNLLDNIKYVGAY